MAAVFRSASSGIKKGQCGLHGRVCCTMAPMNASPPFNDEAPPTQGWVSMRHLQRATAFARATGLGVDELLANAGLAPAQLADADQVVPLHTIEAMLNAVQRQQGDRLFGLHMAGDIQPSTLGAMGHILQACSTLGDLIDVVVRYNGFLSNIGRTSVVHRPGLVELRWECLAGGPVFRRHASEYVVGTFVVLTRLLAPGSNFPAAVQFMHARPDQPEHARAYFDFFQCPVHFGGPHASITVPTALLHKPLPHGDAALKALLEQHADHLLAQRARASSLADDVRRLLTALILAGKASKEAVALQLGTSPRSLHRHLQEAGTSYRDLLDSVRLALAREQLVNSPAPIAEITEQLGFSSRQSFMRWFRQMTGLTPSQHRIAHRGSKNPA